MGLHFPCPSKSPLPTSISRRSPNPPPKFGPHHFFFSISSPYHGSHPVAVAASPTLRPRELPPSSPSSPPSLPLHPSLSLLSTWHPLPYLVHTTYMDAPAVDQPYPFMAANGTLPQHAVELVEEATVSAAEVWVREGAGPLRWLPVQQHPPAPTLYVSRGYSSVPRNISGIARPPRPTPSAKKSCPATASHPRPTGPPPAALLRLTAPPPDNGLRHGQEELSRRPNTVFFPSGTVSIFIEPLYLSSPRDTYFLGRLQLCVMSITWLRQWFHLHTDAGTRLDWSKCKCFRSHIFAPLCDNQ
jgi:hypothetical protein